SPSVARSQREVAMAGPLLETKLHMPRRHRELVDRARLVQKLQRGATAPLTLVSAPPGFGKTTLLATWLDKWPPPGTVTAWLSLDAGDDDPRTFVNYVVAAIGAVAPDAVAGASELLEA